MYSIGGYCRKYILGLRQSLICCVVKADKSDSWWLTCIALKPVICLWQSSLKFWRNVQIQEKMWIANVSNLSQERVFKIYHLIVSILIGFCESCWPIRCDVSILYLVKLLSSWKMLKSDWISKIWLTNQMRRDTALFNNATQ